MLFTLCKSLRTDAQPLCITGIEAGSNLSAITMSSALISAQGSYCFLETHSSGKEPCQCPHGNPSLALVAGRSIQSKKTICWWPKPVMPYFAFSVVWSNGCTPEVNQDWWCYQGSPNWKWLHILVCSFHNIIMIVLTDNYNSIFLQPLWTIMEDQRFLWVAAPTAYITNCIFSGK